MTQSDPASADSRDNAKLNDFHQPQPVILALDTSTSGTSIAVARGDQLIASSVVQGDERRSERLWLDVGDVLKSADLTIESVDLFGVCVGPGGFTGLRVGLAAVKGLAAASGKPAIGVTSLEAAAVTARGALTICAMVGAYKGEVYSQQFSIDNQGLPVALTEPLVSTSKEAIQIVANLPDVIFAGDAVAANVALIRETAGARFIEEATQQGSGWRIQPAPLNTAEAVAHLGWLKWQQGATDDAQSLQAFYVRPSEAEVKLSLGLLGSKIKRSRQAD
jgi:tRNA threonylcarbamoyladenosine biosynthesis protein TsaB